jgi:hypothetical protein
VLLSFSLSASAKLVSCRLWSVPPPKRQAHVDGAMEVLKDLFESLQVCVRGGRLGGAKDAQRRGNIGTRANGRVR